MTVNVNPKPFNISDDLVVRNIKRNIVGSGEQLSLQMMEGTTLHLITRERLFTRLTCRTRSGDRVSLVTVIIATISHFKTLPCIRKFLNVTVHYVFNCNTDSQCGTLHKAGSNSRNSCICGKNTL